MTVFLFVVFGGLTLLGGLGVVLSRNPVHSALWLVLTLVSVAVLFLMQDAELVAAVQIIVYAGAIVVLFLFVIMLLGIDRAEVLTERLPGQRPAALALGAIVLAELIFLAGHEWATGERTSRGIPVSGPGLDEAGRRTAEDLGDNVERIARTLFTDFVWPFQITAVLLVVAVVGSVVLARRSRPPASTSTEPQG